jgi:hypothetical protein
MQQELRKAPNFYVVYIKKPLVQSGFLEDVVYAVAFVMVRRQVEQAFKRSPATERSWRFGF